MENYLYFRTVPDQDNDLSAATSACYPVSSFLGMTPTTDAVLTLYFKPLLNSFGADQDDTTGTVLNLTDSVALAVTTHRHKEVMESLVKAMNGRVEPTGGLIVVADDVTTTYLSSSAGEDETVSAIVLNGDSNITSCGAIAVAAAQS